MEFRQIQYFACLFEEGSVTRAARRLGIVQPALSMQIGKLEQELGQKLFERSTQGMVPTATGLQMYRLFQPVLQDFVSAHEEMLRPDDELSGHVRVGMIASLAQGVLASTLTDFAKVNPRVTVSVTEGYSTVLTDAVAGGQIEAAIINNPRRALPLNIESIVDEDLLLLTSGKREVALPQQTPLRTLTSLKLVLPTRQHGLRTLLETFAQSENMELTPVFETDSLSAIVDLVEDSQLATVLPRVAVRASLEQGRLQARTVISPRLSRLVVAVTNPRRPLPPATAAFVALLTERIRALGGEQVSS
ncbi:MULTISPECIES: LysR family transcriptional regulator [Cupriavidus]